MILIILFVLSAVADVTTAVDIYSFGMCALEVRGYHILLSAVANSLFCSWKICLIGHALMVYQCITKKMTPALDMISVEVLLGVTYVLFL